MEYTKSEIRELKNLIDDDLAILKHYTKIYIPDPLIGIQELCLADFAVTGLDAHLKCMKKYIIDTDNYDLAVEIKGKVTPVWEKYIEKVTNEDERKRLNTEPGHLHFSNIRDTMLDWLDWLDEYEAEHPKQQDTPNNTPSTKDEGNTKTITNDKILKALPDLYDCLVEDGVINGNAISKLDFGGKVAQGNIPRLRQGESEWIKKTTKFKGFIKCIRHCFNDDWYSAICKSADLTDKEMGKYNTDNTAEFEVTIKAKLQHNGIG